MFVWSFLIFAATFMTEVAIILIKKFKAELVFLEKFFVISLFIFLWSLILIYFEGFYLVDNVYVYLGIIFFIFSSFLFQYFNLKSIEYMDRTSSSLGLMLQPLLLLVVDVLLGYNLTLMQIIGSVLIIFILFFVNRVKIYNFKGFHFLLIASIIWVFNVTVFKIIVDLNKGNVWPIVFIYSFVDTLIMLGVLIYKNKLMKVLQLKYLAIWFLWWLNILFQSLAYTFCIQV